MQELKDATQPAIHSPQISLERRDVPRIPVIFGVMYSGMNHHGSLMADGTALDLSRDGLSFRGNYPVRIGMELSMLLYLPDGADPLFILEAHVAWLSNNIVGVEFTKLNLREGNRLLSFLRTRSTLHIQPVRH